MNTWQFEWTNLLPETCRKTRKLIPNIKDFVTEASTGHGFFKEYLQKIGKINSSNYQV